MSLNYTPGQLRNAAAITPETYRHWKKALVPLGGHRGHGPCFSFGDLLAVVSVRVLTNDLGISVGALTGIAEKLFGLCNSTPWPTLERGRFVIDVLNSTIEFRAEIGEINLNATVVILPLRPVIAKLRDQLLTAAKDEEQGTLRFPPTGVNVTPVTASNLGGGRERA